MRPTSAGSSLRGIPYIVFDAVLFFHHNPGLNLFERKNCLVNIHAFLLSKYGLSEQGNALRAIEGKLDSLGLSLEPVDSLDWAIDSRNEYSLTLDQIQREIYAVIGVLGILDSVGMRDMVVPDE